MRKFILIAIAVVSFQFSLMAQHAPQFTNFMFNKLVYNPAYAGSHDMMTMSAIYRNQWSGITGAPITANANLHTPFFNQRCGAGLSIVSDQIGMMQNTYINLSYAYRIKVSENTTLSMGLMGRMEHAMVDWDQAQALRLGDALIGVGQEKQWQANFGAGMYLSSDRFYVGLSAPQILRNSLYSDVNILEDIRNYYVMGGLVFDINHNIKLKPAILMTYNPSAPMEMDFNANFIFMDVFWVGGSYRLGDSFDGIVAYQITRQLRAGMAIDFTLTELNNYTNGSFEFMLQYSLDYTKSGVRNLRYF